MPKLSQGRVRLQNGSLGQEAPTVRALGDRDYPLLWVLAAAALGIVADRYLSIPLTFWCLLFVGGLLTASWLYARHYRWWSALVILSSVAALAGLWHHDRWNLYSDNEIARFCQEAPVPTVVRVETLDAPRRSPAAERGPLSSMARGETTRLDAQVQSIREASHWRRASGRLTLIIDGTLAIDVLRGDELEIAGLLAGVRPALNPGEPDFAGMCRSRRQGAVMFCGSGQCVQRLKQAQAWSLLRQLGRLRIAAEAALDRHVGLRRSPLATALLLGTRERLSQDTVQTLFLSGTLHLLAISGLHVGIVATVFWILLRLNRLPRRRLLWATCLCITAYALMTGGRPPVVRATTLVILYCLARGLGRPPQAWNSLAAAGIVALGLRPSGLFNAGTQLSFLAVATLIAVWPLLSRFPRAHPLERLIAASQPIWLRLCLAAGRKLGQLLLLSTAVWLVGLPLVTYRFHLVAPVGVLLNVALWLPLAGALFLALLTVLLSPLPLVPDWLGACCDTSLRVVELLTTHAAQLDAGHWSAAGPAWWWVTVLYVGLMLWQFTRLPIAPRWWFALLCAWLIVAIVAATDRRHTDLGSKPQPLRLSFIAVEHGTSVLIELPDGKVLLYDAGRMGTPRSAALPISSVLWSRHIHHIDALVLSHADTDHFNAVPDLLPRFSVGIVYVSPVMFRTPAPALQSLRNALDRAQVPIGCLYEGTRLSAPAGVEIEVLHPPQQECVAGAYDQSDNANSIVLQVTSGPFRVLLTGDIEGGGLEELLAERSETCHVLLAPHHGSRNRQAAELVRWARPSVVIISAGARLPIEQAESVYGTGGASVLWTHRQGLIEVVTEGRQLHVSTWR